MSAFLKRFSRAVRTLVVTGLVASAVGVLLFGPRANDAVPRDVVVIDLWAGWTGDEQAAVQSIVDDFNATVGKEKHIYVRHLSLSNVNQKTLVATAAGVPPDIAGLYAQTLAQYASLDALEPLDSLAAEHGITSATYKKVFWDECHYDGKLYGLVSTGYSVGLYMNAQAIAQHADQLRAAGLNPVAGPRSIDELDRFAHTLDQLDANGRLISAGFLPQEPGWYLNATCRWFGGDWWDQDAHRFTFTDPAVVRAYDWVQGYSKHLGGQAMTEFRSGLGTFDSPQNAFLAGTIGMELQGAFLANFVHNQKPSMDGNYVVVPFPSVDPVKLPNVTYCDADLFVLPRGGRHKREAFEFLAYLARQDVMEKLASRHCKTSPLAQVSQSFLSHHPNPYIRVFDALAASPNAAGVESVPIMPEVTAEMDNFMQRLVLQQVTAADGLREMQDRLQAKYDAFIEQQRKRHALN